MVETQQTESIAAKQTNARALGWLRSFLSHRHLPVFLAIGAILVMVPALKVGLFWDDLMQRAVELKPEQLPARMHEAGNPADSGNLSTVLRDLFGFSHDRQNLALTKNYGTLPWWTPNDFRFALWRPVTAFTHWLDYRLFPDSPALMHAHNIAWFAAVVFVVAVVYRKLMAAGWGAGLAGLLFLLDVHTYFPVAFVANRGFIMALFFGLLCLHEHHQWRCAKSRSGGVLSALFLALSLFADEGGASTFAFILAYAVVLEPGSVRKRALTLLPSILVIVVWRAVYTACGFGVVHAGGYIDPAIEPLAFGRAVIPRAMALLAGQLTGVAPDILAAFSPALQPKVMTVFCGLGFAALVIFLPCVRRDKTAAFWFAVMVLAAIPAATVAPLSKNLGFVAVGAYGVIACFVAGLVSRNHSVEQEETEETEAAGRENRSFGLNPPSSVTADYGATSRLPGWLPSSLTYRILAWATAALLMLAHVPGAVVGRVVAVKGTPFILGAASRLGDVGDWPNIENQDVIIVNPPLPLAVSFAPFYRAYQHRPLPRTLRVLVPGLTGFEVQRTDDRTLVIQSQGPDIFSCDDFGPFRGGYGCQAANLTFLDPKFKRGDRSDLGGLTVEVLEVDASNLPSRVAFRFGTPLDSPDLHWVRFDIEWAVNDQLPYAPFKIPAIGQTVTLPSPRHREESEGKRAK